MSMARLNYGPPIAVPVFCAGGSPPGGHHGLVANVTAALRWRISPPVVAMTRFPGANEPCRKHAFAITLGYLTT